MQQHSFVHVCLKTLRSLFFLFPCPEKIWSLSEFKKGLHLHSNQDSALYLLLKCAIVCNLCISISIPLMTSGNHRDCSKWFTYSTQRAVYSIRNPRSVKHISHWVCSFGFQIGHFAFECLSNSCFLRVDIYSF